MNTKKLFDALNSLFAYDTGSHDSGISDPLLKREVISFLKLEREKELHAIYPQVLSLFIREHFLTDEQLLKGYGVEDVKSFIEWVNNELGIE